MGKVIRRILIVGLLALVMGLSSNAIVSHAWTTINKYTWRSGKSDAAIYYTNTTQNAYIWNNRFNKKLHNLKNYPYTTWYVTRSFVHKNRVYYAIGNYGSKVKGYVWHGYVTPAVVKDINRFNSDADYLNYLNTDPSQKLSRALLKLIPNANVSLKLSKQAAMNQITDYQNVIDLGKVSGTVKVGLLTSKTTVHDFLMDRLLPMRLRPKRLVKCLQPKAILVINWLTS